MAACNFNFPFTGNPEIVLNKAKSAVESQGGTFQGDQQSGNFNLTVFGNTIAGSYTLAGSSMEVIITEKPFLLPCGTIEGFLKSQLGL